MRMRDIILIGFMGAGKTTVGKRLAGSLGCRFVDTDEYIVSKAGMPVSEIFERYGEENFRARETDALRDLLSEEDMAVLSVGGGLPMREENRRYLRELGKTVYLRARTETLVKRLAGDESRPLLRGQDLQERITELLRQRGAVYEAAADIILDTDGKNIGIIVQEIAEIAGGSEKTVEKSLRLL